MNNKLNTLKFALAGGIWLGFIFIARHDPPIMAEFSPLSQNAHDQRNV